MAKIDPIPDVPVPDRVPRAWGLGLLFENALIRFIVSVFNRVRVALAETFRYAVDRVLDTLEIPAINILRPLIARAFDNPDLPPELRALGDQLLSGQHQVEVAMLIPIAIGLVVGVVAGAFRPFGHLASYFVDRQVHSARLDPGTAIHARWRDPALGILAEGDLHELGWTDQRIAAAELVAKQRLQLGELLVLWRRDELSDSALVDRAARIGFNLPELPELKKLSELIPGPADLVRFALREAWRDDVAEKWGYDQAFVGEFGEWMQKQGLSAEWAKRYWRSHWVVPGAAQGFEMMWREVITEAELEELLKINDLAPGWIPKLMQVARPVPGRIDRRYAFREGEIGWDDLFQLYKFDGYTDDWATILANTTAKMAVSEAKGLTRAAVEKAYRKRRLSQDEAVAMLADIGIQEAIARFYLAQADADRSDDLLDRRVDVVGRRYLDGDLLEPQVRDELVALGVSGDEIAVYFEEWNIRRGAKTKRPSRANLDKFFREGIITIGQYHNQMDRLGYSPLYVDWYLGALAIERQQILEKEEKDARAERERVERDRRRTDYQVAKSRMDVDISELQAAIASAQVALIAAQSERDRRLSLALPAVEIVALEREYQPLLFDAGAAISEARLEIARLQALIREKREAISLVDRSLIENVDMTRYEGLRAGRLRAQTEQARLGELIAAAKVAIAELKEAIAAFVEPVDVAVAKEQILVFQTDIARNQEMQARLLTEIEEIDELMAEVLSAVRRQELQAQKATFATDVAAIETEIAALREAIRQAQSEKESLEHELETRITALPGRDVQITIRAEYQILIAEIQGRIREMRENVAQLRVAKARLLTGYREG